jgi:hypothetical protein
MSHPRITRWLRIAWSAGWGIVAVLLLASWGASYLVSTYALNDVDIPERPFRSQKLSLSSYRGNISIESRPGSMWPHTYGWQTGSYRINRAKESPYTVSGFQWQTSATGYLIQTPHWFLVLAFGTISVMPWAYKLRFSLRTLLLATTLVGVLLGLIAASS